MRQSQCGRARRAVLAALLLAVLAAVLAAGCGKSVLPDVVAASGEPATRQFDLSGFTAVVFDSGVVASLYQADEPAVAATLDGGLVKYMVVKVDGDTLYVGLKPGKMYSGLTFRVSVAMPVLERLEATGGSRVRVYGFASADPLALALTRGSYIALSGVEGGAVTADVGDASGVSGDLTAKTLTATVSASSRLGVTGAADSAVVDASGGSGFDLGTFTVRDLQAKLSGGSHGTVLVTGTLDADVSGGSQLEYGGTPTLGDVQTSGGSQVKRMGD